MGEVAVSFPFCAFKERGNLRVAWRTLPARLDLPFEVAPPFGELGLAEDFQSAFPVKQVAGDGAHPLLALTCCWSLSQGQGRFLIAGMLLSLFGVL